MQRLSHPQNISISYHQYPHYPAEALKAAALLYEYTLTDKGTYLAAPADIQTSLEVYLIGSGAADDPLLNPARLLLGAKTPDTNIGYAKDFLAWMVHAEGGQKVIREFKINGQVLYSVAP